MVANEIWALLCILVGLFFVGMGLLFAILKERAAKLLAGFNDFSAEQRLLYDQKRISADKRNSFFVSAIIAFVSGLLSLFNNTPFGIIGFILAFAYQFMDFSLTKEKAFDKYKLP